MLWITLNYIITTWYYVIYSFNSLAVLFAIRTECLTGAHKLIAYCKCENLTLSQISDIIWWWFYRLIFFFYFHTTYTMCITHPCEYGIYFLCLFIPIHPNMRISVLHLTPSFSAVLRICCLVAFWAIRWITLCIQRECVA